MGAAQQVHDQVHLLGVEGDDSDRQARCLELRRLQARHDVGDQSLGLRLVDAGAALLLAKARPRTLSFASPGNGHAAHLGGELLKELGGVDMLHVHYQGSGAATNDLIGGQTTMLFALVSDSLQLIKSGRLRAIAIPTKARSPMLPEVPTFAESGMPDFDLTAWFGLIGIAGTPQPVLRRLNARNSRVVTPPRKRSACGLFGRDEPMSLALFARRQPTRRQRDRHAMGEYPAGGHVLKRRLQWLPLHVNRLPGHPR